MKEKKNGELFVLPLDNLPSRNSSMNRSSRLYYRRTTEGVPFQWEMQPGTPKNYPLLTEALPPPISPPPALLSLGLSKPAARLQNKQPPFLLFGRWIRKHSKSKNHSSPSNNNQPSFDDHPPRFASCGPHCEFMESPCKANDSSSSSSSLQPAESSGQRPLGCGPWRISPMKIAIGRRV